MPGPSPLVTRCEAALAPRLEQRILPGLERMQLVLDGLSHPERRFPRALIVGTNGKGATAAFLAGILAAHGLRVGLYTSPHLLRVEERIQIDGEAISPQQLLALLGGLQRYPQLSYFETLTAAAFLEFAARRVDIAVLEAGLGGRWDATNAAPAAVSMLTNVGTDHQAWLGGTRAAIAAEKAAALRGHEAIVGSWDEEVAPAIRAHADPETRLSLAAEWAAVSSVRAPGSGREAAADRDRVRFTAAGATGEAAMPLLGRHQRSNLVLALAGAAALSHHRLCPPLAAAAVARGIETTRWPGRLQWCTWRGHRLLLDGAHNLEAARALAAALDELELSGKVDLLFSCLADKPLAEMAATLGPRAVEVSVAPLDSPRAAELARLLAAFPGCLGYPGVAEALARMGGDRPTVVTGSLRLVGEVLSTIGGDGGG